MDDPLKVAVSPLRRVAVSLILIILPLAIAACTAPVRVEWSTETEMNTAGFNLYRGEAPDGPFDVRVNDQIIAPAQDPMLGGKYQFVDQTARPGVTYYYQLQEVEKNGSVNAYGPISVRAGGLAWGQGRGLKAWQVLIFIALAAVAVALWVIGGRREARKRTG